MEHSGHGAAGPVYNVNLQTDPARPRAGEPVALRLVVTEQAAGEALTDFELLHDRLLHLIIVNQDLSLFDHVHPSLEGGTFQIDHVFQRAGSYKLWAEARPSGAQSVLAAFRLDVTGPDAPPAASTSGSGDYRVELDYGGDLVAHQPARLVFSVSQRDGRPVTDLESLMAAGGHCVIVSSDLRDFLHVHPEQDVGPDWRGGPEVAFGTAFHRPGDYAAWGQFQHRGRTITEAFRLNVRPAAHH